jgi:putative DNA primase/helicase
MPGVPSMRDAAGQLVAAGYYLLPLYGVTPDGRCTCGNQDCSSAGKHPRISGGCKAASNDPEVVHHWWSTWPDANIGIATGREAGIFVLDVDEKSGGPASLAELEARHGPLPATLRSTTGGGGFHLYFRYPADGRIPNSTSRVGPGLDVRGDGGYVVAPPSLHKSGRRYQWEPSK